MEENRAAPRAGASGRAKARGKKKHGAGWVIGRILLGLVTLVFTLAVIGILTGGLFYRTFMRYVDTVLEPEMDVDLAAYSLKQSSVIYYADKASGQWVELTKLHGEENRTLVDYHQIPDHVVKALIAIEDKRFYEHEGVDWKSTARQILNMLTGQEVRGASTITQQLIKNVTGNDQVTIRRKILEIFQALRVHKNYSEEDIIENYFNQVFFGHNAWGIEAAAETYFGKRVEELTVAEGAAIVGITQNPWQYDPLRSDWSREQNRERQLTVLYEMKDQNWLSDAEYERARTEKMVFVGDRDYVEQPEDGAEEEEQSQNEELESFFVEQVFRDVVDALEEKGYNTRAAQTLLYTGGYKIYCTLDPRLQEIVERVYADQGNFNYMSEKGEMLQSGMTIIDNYSHNIVAIAGRVGERKGALEWSYAASLSPCGSAIKPISVYAPAIDAGILTAASVIDDYPVYELSGSAYPVNAYSGYRGLMTIQEALRQSSNTAAMRTLERLTPTASYAFLQDRLGISTLTTEDMTAMGALALGGLTNGVSTIEMAAAYSTFANNGVYTTPRTFIEVRDSYGNVVIDNKQDSWVAMKESTVYTINELLRGVMRSGGTGSSAAFSGMTMAGKTGTTNSKRDKYFVGYTPYYTAAVWTGFGKPARMNTDDNPAALAWNKVMKQIHDGLPDADFPTTSAGMVSVTACSQTGLLAGAGCTETRTVLVAQGTAPALTCDAHVSVDFCTESGLPAGEFCPEEARSGHWAVDLSAPNTAASFGYTRQSIFRPLSGEQYNTYAAQVEAGLRETMPDSAPIYARDSEYVLSDIETMGTCILHLEPEEGFTDPENPGGWEDPQNPTDPNNPSGWFENPLNPFWPANPENPGTQEPGTQEPSAQEPGAQEPAGAGGESGQGGDEAANGADTDAGQAL